MNTKASPEKSVGPTTRAIAQLLPGVRRGDQAALNELVTIAHSRLVQLVRRMKGIYAGKVADRHYRGDEQTGVILSHLFIRLRNAVESQKLSELNHPAGFWKIAADNVMYILLDMARDRKRDRERRHGQDNVLSLDAEQFSGSDNHARGGRRGAVATAEEDSRSNDFARDRPIDPLEQIDDQDLESSEDYMSRQEVIEAVRQLPEPHRTILSMYYYLGLTQREILEILESSEPHLHERKVGRIIDQAEEKMRPVMEKMQRDRQNAT